MRHVHRQPSLVSLLALASGLPLASAEPQYSTNAICQQKSCINPVFPGMNVLEDQEKERWQCLESRLALQHMDFCRGVLSHMIAVKSPPHGTNRTVRSVVMEQDQAAASAYFYHLSALGIEPWEHVKPDQSFHDGPCVRSVQDMVCATFFPRAQTGCKWGEETEYIRPCKSACERYVEACGIQCCDESVKCVFNHEVTLLGGDTHVFKGYVDELESSGRCTGNTAFMHLHSATSRSNGGVLGLLLGVAAAVHACGSLETFTSTGLVGRKSVVIGILAVLAMSLQGCHFHYHYTANWRQKPHYLLTFQYVPPLARGADPASRKPTVNSCEVPGLDPQDQCNGHGECVPWKADSSMKHPIMFCACDRDWADPECRTQRRSQATAYWLSLFGGVFGLDRFYLRQPGMGSMKLATLGGLGFWWVYDIVLIGTDPIYAGEYRVAYDLSHWLYVFSALSFFIFLGLVLFATLASSLRRHETKQSMLLLMESAYDEQRHRDFISRLEKDSMPSMSSYGVPRPTPSAQFYQYGSTA